MADRKPAPKPAPKKTPPKKNPAPKPKPAPEPAPVVHRPNPDQPAAFTHGPFTTYTEITLKNGGVVGLAPGELFLEETE